jgi:hypothetical protein
MIRIGMLSFHECKITAAAIACFCVLFLSQTSVFAQSPPVLDASQGETVHRIVLLDVRAGGTDAVVDALGGIEFVRIERQAWFLEQVKSRGFKIGGIMRRANDLKWVMSGASVNYIVYFKGAAAETPAYDVVVIGTEGAAVLTFQVPKTDAGIDAAGATMIAKRIESFLPKLKQPEKVIVAPPTDSTKNGPVEEKTSSVVDKALAEKEIKKASTDKELASKRNADVSAEAEQEIEAKQGTGFLRLGVVGKYMQREFGFASQTRAVLAYRSKFFPGYGVDVELFPLEDSGLGFWGGIEQGFDSFTLMKVGGGEDGERKEVAGTHLAAWGGLSHRSVTNRSEFSLRLGGRFDSENLDENDSLPSMGFVSLTFGGDFIQEFLPDIVDGRVGFDFVPYGKMLEGEDLFGTSSYLYGMSGSAGVMIHMSETLLGRADVEFGMRRILFEGAGSRFEDVESFHFLRSVSVGLVYGM